MAARESEREERREFETEKIRERERERRRRVNKYEVFEPRCWSEGQGMRGTYVSRSDERILESLSSTSPKLGIA